MTISDYMKIDMQNEVMSGEKKRENKLCRTSLGDNQEPGEGDVGEVLRGGGDGAAAAELRHICLCTCVGGAVAVRRGCFGVDVVMVRKVLAAS